jgi:hypothetical protein
VDDITTAIQIGWKMAGVTPSPELDYHKETKLLIAYGEPDQLQTIEDVLQALPKPAPARPRHRDHAAVGCRTIRCVRGKSQDGANDHRELPRD